MVPVSVTVRLVAALAGAGLVALLACFSEREATAPAATGECLVPVSAAGSVVVAIRDFSFQPAIVNVPAGATVTWVNCEPETGEAHTSTSDNGVWSSELLPPGATFSHTFDQAGSFPYHCEPHPFMTGTVVVE
jgi:plastocyanin